MRVAAAAIGAELSSLRVSPDFHRLSARRGEDVTVVDLVIDRAPQLVDVKPSVGKVRLDPLEEIAANKICALLGRSAPRDLIDLDLLLRRGFELASLIAAAQRKEGGVDPATLAWVLSDLRIAPLAALPAGATREELERIRLDLVDRLTRLALPPERSPE